jgi:hypothetical protein
MSELEQGTGERRGAAHFHKPCRTELGLYNAVKDMRDRKVYGVDKPSAAIIWVVVECQRGMSRKKGEIRGPLRLGRSS